ncbi:STAS domain-containing protein [Geodermatophilus sp. SYSU D00708]
MPQRFACEHAVDRLRVLAVVVDGLAPIGSAGLTFLARWAQSARAEGRPAQIRRATRRFSRVLELSGLTPLFDLAASPPLRPRCRLRAGEAGPWPRPRTSGVSAPRRARSLRRTGARRHDG